MSRYGIKQKSRSCPVCSSEKKKFLKKIVMRVPEEYHLPDCYNVVVCEKCGFVYSDTNASLEDYDWYYSRCNFYSDDSHDDFFLRYKTVEIFLEKYLEKDSLLLELGSGNGRFAMELKEHGYAHIVGTDPSEESVKRLQERGIHAYVANIYEEVPLEEHEKYDCIFLFEVAEHLLLPEKGIENVRKMLKKDGIFMISIPDYSQIGEEVSSISNYFNLEHINYFSENSLDCLLALNGMKRIDQKHVGMDLSCVYRKMEKEKIERPDRDHITEAAVCQYFERQKGKEERIQDTINKLRQTGEELVIWGTGSYTMSLLATTGLLHCKIIAFVDNNKIKHGREIYGYKICPPEYLQDKKCTVLICSMLNGEVIQKQLEAMGTNNKIILL